MLKARKKNREKNSQHQIIDKPKKANLKKAQQLLISIADQDGTRKIKYFIVVINTICKKSKNWENLTQKLNHAK